MDKVCEVCGMSGEECKCPECKQCGSKGDPRCYKEHGLEKADHRIKKEDLTVAHKHKNDMSKVPDAACPKCGGWMNSGGMSQHAGSAKPVNGRTGCKCNGNLERHKQNAAVKQEGKFSLMQELIALLEADEGDYGVRYRVAKGNAPVQTKEKLCKTKGALDAFVKKVEKSDGFVEFVSWLYPEKKD